MYALVCLYHSRTGACLGAAPCDRGWIEHIHRIYVPPVNVTSLLESTCSRTVGFGVRSSAMISKPRWYQARSLLVVYGPAVRRRLWQGVWGVVSKRRRENPLPNRTCVQSCSVSAGSLTQSYDKPPWHTSTVIHISGVNLSYEISKLMIILRSWKAILIWVKSWKSMEIMKNHQKSWNIIRNHDKSSKFMEYHQKSWNIIKNHDKSSTIMKYHQKSW